MMYVANELANTVTSFSVSYPSSGCMAFEKQQELSPFPDNADAPSGTKVGEVHVKDNFVYNSNRADGSFSGNDSIATWSLSSTGAMTFQGLTNSYGTYPRTFAINAAGTYMAVGDQTTANVAILERDPSTGELGDLVANLRIGSIGHAENEDGLSAVVWAR
jgi:6-phosphogluconolactonase (cycloisomerase 2 family)